MTGRSLFMKLNAVILTALWSITASAGENINFDTKPDFDGPASKNAIASLRILPEGLKKDRFCRITIQVKLTAPGVIVSGIYRGKEKPLWSRSGSFDTEWRKYCLYAVPGEDWTCTLTPRPKGNTFLVKDVRIEALGEEDLTGNLLPPLKEAGWHTVWNKKEAKIGFEPSEDSPFGAEVLAAEIGAGTGNPATPAVPVVPGRTLVLNMWVKGEPDEVWLATLSGSGSQKFPVTGEWRRRELRFQIKTGTPAAANIVFWKNKNRKPLKCVFGKVEAYYEK